LTVIIPCAEIIVTRSEALLAGVFIAHRAPILPLPGELAVGIVVIEGKGVPVVFPLPAFGQGHSHHTAGLVRRKSDEIRSKECVDVPGHQPESCDGAVCIPREFHKAALETEQVLLERRHDKVSVPQELLGDQPAGAGGEPVGPLDLG